jgi:hypothetical protein
MLTWGLSPIPAAACACGCGVFEVGTTSMVPNEQGWMLAIEYDFMSQNKNWSGTARAPVEDNEDRLIRTSFITASGQYMVNRAWGIAADVPYWSRLFSTTGDEGDIASFTHGALGDVRLRGLYTGFSDDMSSGAFAGFKFPTGDYRYANFDRDTEIGTGSTDVLIGAYHVGPLTADRAWSWFVEGQWQQPFAYAGEYRPGGEADVTTAVFHSSWAVGIARVAPLLEAIGTVRQRDHGVDSNPGDSGYSRIFLAPGLDVSLIGIRAIGTVSIPLFQRVNGNQLVAPVLLKLEIGYPL